MVIVYKLGKQWNPANILDTRGNNLLFFPLLLPDVDIQGFNMIMVK